MTDEKIYWCLVALRAVDGSTSAVQLARARRAYPCMSEYFREVGNNMWDPQGIASLKQHLSALARKSLEEKIEELNVLKSSLPEYECQRRASLLALLLSRFSPSDVFVS